MLETKYCNILKAGRPVVSYTYVVTADENEMLMNYLPKYQVWLVWFIVGSIEFPYFGKMQAAIRAVTIIIIMTNDLLLII